MFIGASRGPLLAGGLASLALSVLAPAQEPVRARELLNQGRFAAARLEVERLKTQEPDHRELPYLTGRIALVDHDVARAIRDLEKAVERDAENADHHYWLGVAIAEATKTASRLKQPFMAKRVMREWERAVEIDRNHVGARAQLVAFYSIVPGFMGGSRLKARAQAAEIGRVSPWRGSLALGAILEQEKKTVEAQAAYREAISAAPDSGDGYFALGFIHAREGRAAEALSVLDEYARRQPADRWVKYHVGRCAAVTGSELDRGVAELMAFLGDPPTDLTNAARAHAHFRLGELRERRGEREAAGDAFRAALAANPRHGDAKRGLERLVR
jgi:tetratricopeptide (TPR) repeat protein